MKFLLIDDHALIREALSSLSPEAKGTYQAAAEE